MLYLTQGEVKVLEVLGDRRWQVPSEIAAEADLHVQLVRSILSRLVGYRLVERGGWGDSTRWGEWRITDAGAEQLLARAQQELPIR